MSTVEIRNNITTQFGGLIQRLTTLPLWVKQAVYCELKLNLAETSDVTVLDRIESKIIQLYKPKLTGNSNRVLNNLNAIKANTDFSNDHKVFIKCANEGMTLLEIAHQNEFSFKKTCKILLDLIEQGYLENIEDKGSFNFLLYITEKIRLGEFLVRTNRLTTLQLDKALYTKKCADELETGLTFKDVLCNLGYMSARELNNIGAIKESSEQAVRIIDVVQSQSDELNSLQDQLDAALFENKKLEDQITFYKKELEEKCSENLELTKQIEKYTKGFVGKLFASLT